MKIGIVTERISPPDKRVAFSPSQLTEVIQKYPTVSIKVESSTIRCFSDVEYKALGIEVSDDLSDCDVLFGIKEIPETFLIPNKKYFFFSHTIKGQANNRLLLRSVLQNNIELYDYEALVDSNNKRLLGFGKYAGIVGAYNALRLFGLKYGLFKLVKAEILEDKTLLYKRVKKMFLPPIKILVTGKGRVSSGIQELLQSKKIQEVSAVDFLTKQYSDPVYAVIDSMDYFKKYDNTPGDKSDFYANPQDYTSDFAKYASVTDILITGHFQSQNAPAIVTREHLLSVANKLSVVADISCDIDGSIACSKQVSSIAEPFYGYLPTEDKIVEYHHPAGIAVMSVNNLPCELSKDASVGFGEMLLETVIPALLNGDDKGDLSRAQVTTLGGELTKRFSYLESFVD